MFGFGKKKQEETPAKSEHTAPARPIRLTKDKDIPKTSIYYPEYKVGVYWGDFLHDKGRIDPEKLLEFLEEHHLENAKYKVGLSDMGHSSKQNIFCVYEDPFLLDRLLFLYDYYGYHPNETIFGVFFFMHKVKEYNDMQFKELESPGYIARVRKEREEDEELLNITPPGWEDIAALSAWAKDDVPLREVIAQMKEEEEKIILSKFGPNGRRIYDGVEYTEAEQNAYDRGVMESTLDFARWLKAYEKSDNDFYEEWRPRFLKEMGYEINFAKNKERD